MAQFLPAQGWAPPDLLTMHLRESLPASYIIVAATRIYGCPIETLVVAPDGLYVLYPKDWQGEIRTTAQGGWIVTVGVGASIQVPNPALEANHCQRALTSFLKDEFPALRLAIHHVMVLIMPSVRLATDTDIWPPLMTLADVGAMIVTAQPPTPQLEEPVREELAIALRDRQLTHSQRASEPFIFRTGSRSVWTVREAIQHMDRHRADGIYHLHNGTLIRWLRSEGAEHLATLAEAVMRQVTGDERAMVETFLVATGLVARPLLTLRPSHVELGPIVSGESASAIVEVKQVNDRGYLFGSFFASEPWLRIEPDYFAGTPVEVVITVETETLAIRANPYAVTVDVLSSASDAPLPITVNFKVVGFPSRLERYLLRPLVSMGALGTIGVFLGALLSAAITSAPAGSGGNLFRMGPFWMVGIGLVWAFAGSVHSRHQPPGLPLKTTLWRLMRRLTVWTAALSVVTAGCVWGGQALATWLELSVRTISPITAGLAGATLAVVPTTFMQHHTPKLSVRHPKKKLHSMRIRYAVVGVTILLALLLATGLQTSNVSEVAGSVTIRSSEWLSSLEARLNQWTDELILRVYDRRAPAQSR